MATEAQEPQPLQPGDAPTPAENVNNDSQPTAQATSQSNPQEQEPTPSASTSSQTQPTAPEQPPSSSSGPQPAPKPPASPPLPQRPVALTPGARAQRLNKLFDSTLTHTLAKVSPDNFAACYPTIASQAPIVLAKFQAGLVQRMGERCTSEFAKIMARNEVVARLNELEGLVGDASLRRKTAATAAQRTAATRKGKERATTNTEENSIPPPPPTPPHLLSAEQILAAHLAPQLASQQSQLNARLQNMQAANAKLWETVASQRAELDGLLGALEGALRDVDGAAELMDGVPAEELAVESRAVEAEMVDV